MQLVSWIAKQTGKISDRFNEYKFYVKQQPEVIDSSSTVCIQTFDSRDMTATIPCAFRWFTVRNGLTTEIPQFKGNTYICEPSDVGCLLQVEITSSDPECTGTAMMTYGPVKFDVLLKKEIQLALSTGESLFVVDIGEGNFSRECQFRIQEERITISHIPTETVFTFDYNTIEPKIETATKVLTKARIVFNPRYHEDLHRFVSRLFNRQFSFQQITHNPFLEINMNNRKARDSMIFITKAFNTKKHLQSSAYVSNLEKQLDFTKMTEKDSSKSFDYLEQISQLNRDISKLIEINGKNYMEKRTYLEENKRLEKEIEEIVSTYLKIIEEKFQGREDFEKSFVVLKEKEQEIKMQKDQKYVRGIESLQEKISFLEQENLRLKETIKAFNNGEVPLSNTQTNSPFKRKAIFQSSSPSSNNMIQTPSFEQISSKEEEKLRKELSEMRLKYEELKRQTDELMTEKIRSLNGQIEITTHQNVRNQHQVENGEFNLDAYDARSVKSARNQTPNKTEHNMSQSLLISMNSNTINPQKLKFYSIDQPLKPTSPQSSLQSYPIVSSLQQQNNFLKGEIFSLQQKLSSMTQQYSQKQQKYKKRITDLTQELEMYKRNNDVLNRSQHLSMEMQEYNQTQNKALKDQNQYLKKEIQTLQNLCLKYKTQLKKYKNLDKTMTEKSIVLNEVPI